MNDKRDHNSIWEIIMGSDGNMVSDPNAIKIEAVRHFHLLFLDLVHTLIVDQMNTVHLITQTRVPNHLSRLIL